MQVSGKAKYFWSGALAAVFSFAALIVGLGWAFEVNLSRLAQLARFVGAVRYVEMQYVEAVDFDKLMNGAISGMVKSLGDPYSMYLSPEMYRRMKDHASAQFGGIGVVMSFEDGVNIISVMPGTPGEEAGLKAGDKILAVDGAPTEAMAAEEVALHIRGEPGTETVLTIRRGKEEPRDYTIIRDNIHVRTARGEMVEDGIGYIRIASFAESTAQEFEESHSLLREAGMRGLILDLRSNPGGFITSCVDIANIVVPKGLIVSVVERDGERQEYFSDREGELYPMVVLIDRNSASAAEILAGALQDRGAATIVGETSYGKGSVQMIMPIFGADDALKLTIAKYYTPNGRSISGTGIVPDVEAALPEGATEDEPFKRGVAILKDKLKL